ncbi:MAG: hypothetical protein IPF66_20165, partial [Holophagales bacterium]|nr:hypothetical protein [Holophagales bacterium]
MNEPSLLDLLRRLATPGRLLRLILVAAAVGSLGVAASLLTSPAVPFVRLLAWVAAAIALGEVARLAGRARIEIPPAAPLGAAPRRRPSARSLGLVAIVLLG